jgi:hypothetical protein
VYAIYKENGDIARQNYNNVRAPIIPSAYKYFVKPTLGATVPAKKKEEMINALLLIFSNDPAAMEIDDVEDEEEFADNEEDNIES